MQTKWSLYAEAMLAEDFACRAAGVRLWITDPLASSSYVYPGCAYTLPVRISQPECFSLQKVCACRDSSGFLGVSFHVAASALLESAAKSRRLLMDPVLKSDTGNTGCEQPLAGHERRSLLSTSCSGINASQARIVYINLTFIKFFLKISSPLM